MLPGILDGRDEEIKKKPEAASSAAKSDDAHMVELKKLAREYEKCARKVSHVLNKKRNIDITREFFQAGGNCLKYPPAGRAVGDKSKL